MPIIQPRDTTAMERPPLHYCPPCQLRVLQ